MKGSQQSVIAPTTPAALLAFRDHEGLPPEGPRALPLAAMFAKLARATVQRGILQRLSAVRGGEGWVGTSPRCLANASARPQFGAGRRSVGTIVVSNPASVLSRARL